MKGGIIFARFVTFNQSISTSKEIQTKLTMIRVYWGRPKLKGEGPKFQKIGVFGTKNSESLAPKAPKFLEK